MKKFIVILVALVCLSSCGNSDNSYESNTTDETTVLTYYDNYISKILSSEPDPEYKDIYYFNCYLKKDNNDNQFYDFDLYYSGNDIEEYPMLLELSLTQMSFFIYTQSEFESYSVPVFTQSELERGVIPESWESSQIEQYKQKLISKIANTDGKIVLYDHNSIIASFSYNLPIDGKLKIKDINFDEYIDEQYRHIFESHDYYIPDESSQ